MEKWKDKIVIVTGGGSGIGEACAKRFLKAGAKVYITGRTEAKLKRACDSMGLGAAYIAGDVSKVSDCERIVSTVVKREGRLDVLVNSAGVWIEGPSDTMTEEQWAHCIDTNLKGTFFMCRYAIPDLEKVQGCIINISSDSGLVGNKEAAIYCASKGGVTLLTRALAVELAERKVRVNAVCPGDVMSPMMEEALRDYGGGDPKIYYKALLEHYPQGAHARFTKPEEVAESVFFLAQPEVEAITGACLSIDFGLTAGY